MSRGKRANPNYYAATQETFYGAKRLPVPVLPTDNDGPLHEDSHKNLLSNGERTAFAALRRQKQPELKEPPGQRYEYRNLAKRIGRFVTVDALDSGEYVGSFQTAQQPSETWRMLVMSVPGVATHDFNAMDTCAAMLFGMLGAPVGKSELPKATYVRDFSGRRFRHQYANPMLYDTPNGAAMIVPSEQAGFLMFSGQIYSSASDAEAAYGRIGDIRYVKSYSGAGAQKLDMTMRRADVDLRILGGYMASLAADVQGIQTAARELLRGADITTDADYTLLGRSVAVDMPSL